jgi:hypothetical protein
MKKNGTQKKKFKHKMESLFLLANSGFLRANILINVREPSTRKIYRNAVTVVSAVITETRILLEIL